MLRQTQPTYVGRKMSYRSNSMG